jgi:hypothetical protein
MDALQTPSVNLRTWQDFHNDPMFLMPPRKLLTPDTKIFAMGSCFALELCTALVDAGWNVFPDYRSVAYDPTRQIYGNIPKRYALTHFDTFNMRQELEGALGLWNDREASFVEVRDRPANRDLAREKVYQDPLRKLVYATTPMLLYELSKRIDAAIRAGLEQADMFIFTLGLTEVWKQKFTGRWLCTAPGSVLGGTEALGTFHLSSFSENLDNMRAIIELLAARYPHKPVVLSVSPVHLETTFVNSDVGTASMESKSILRAVAGQIAREYPHVVYFPAYEMAHFWNTAPVFLSDGRHVTRDFAKRVVTAFLTAFS